MINDPNYPVSINHSEEELMLALKKILIKKKLGEKLDIKALINYNEETIKEIPIKEVLKIVSDLSKNTNIQFYDIALLKKCQQNDLIAI